MAAPKLTMQGAAPESTASGRLSDKNRTVVPRVDVNTRYVSQPTG